MKKVLINALSALQGGGQTYLVNLLAEFPNNEFEITVLTSARNNEIFEKIPNLKLKCLGLWSKNVLLRTVWENFYLPFFLNNHSFKILFSPGGIIPIFLFKSKDRKLITVSQNMLPFLPEQILNEKNLKLKIKFIILFFVQSFSFKKSDSMIFLSHYAKDLISKRINLKNQFDVIPHGLSELFLQKIGSPIQEDFALYVSSFYSYKCQLELLKAWEIFKKKNPQNKTKLFLIGDLSTSYGHQVREFVNERNMNDQVKLLGPVPYLEINKFMQSSRLNIFASTCENCPNILLEYLASGQPIMSSSFDPMPEFAKDAVIYFNPTDVDEMVLKFEDFFIKNSFDVKSFVEKSILESKKYSWQETRNKTWNVFRNAV